MLDTLSKISAAALKEIKRRIKKKVDADYRAKAWLKAGGFPVKLDDTFESIYLHALADYHLNWDPFELVSILKVDHVQAAYYAKIFGGKEEHNGLAEALRKEGELIPDILQQQIFRFSEKLVIDNEETTVYRADGRKLEKQLEQFEVLLLEYRERAKKEADKEIIQKLDGIPDKIIHELQKIIQQPTSQVIPKRLNKLPKSIDEFIGREDELKDLEKLLQGEKPVLLLNGIGGIGKTTLAKKYLHSHYDYYDHIAWVSVLQEGSSEEEGFQSAAEALAGDPKLFNNLGIPFDLEESDQARIKRVLETFEQLPGKNLLIIDNAGFSLKDIRSQLPKPPEWHVLVTSRKKVPGLYPKPIDELPPAKALELFYAHYPQGLQVEEEIKSLLEYIGYHTLTIELFAKTCRKSPSVNPTLILDKLKGKKFEELSRKVWVAHSDREVEVYGYLLAIFELADSELGPKEVEILTQLSVLPSEAYSWEFLLEVFQIEKQAQEAFETALIGLIEKGWVAGEGTYKVHQLIQEIIRYKFSPTEENCDNIIQGASSLLEIDYSKDNPIEKFPLIIYGEAILSHINNDGEHISILKNNLALVYKDLGRYEEAAGLLEAALASDQKNFGPDHPEVAIKSSNLATVYKDLGRYEEAAGLLEAALASDQKNFGPDHPTVAIRSSNLALVYRDLGRYEEAAGLLEAALASDQKNFGPDHPTVARRSSNLALVYRDLGRYEEAAGLLEAALASDQKNFGPDHPTVVRSSSNLALVYQALGRYEEAAGLLEAALASDQKNFGPDHPKVAIRSSNLATVYRALGRYEEATGLLEAALASAQKNFGPDHPTVAISSSNLALVYQALGRYEEAVGLLEAALASDQKNFGPDHPNMAISSSNLATVYKALGRYEEAAGLLEAALASDQKNLGPVHPTVAIRSSNLAVVYQALGRIGEAKELLESAYSIWMNSFGESHPYTQMVIKKLANLEEK